VEVKPLPPFLLAGLRAQRTQEIVRELSSGPELDLSRFPATVRGALKPYQLDGIRFIVQRKGRGLIADEMGRLHGHRSGSGRDEAALD
jgi:hypothetical protein